MKYPLKWLYCAVGTCLLIVSCSPKAEQISDDDAVGINERDSQLLEQESSKANDSRDRENIISEAIDRYELVLSEDEKALILEPAEAAFKEAFSNKNFDVLRSKVELRLDLREAQLRGDPDFDSSLNEYLGHSFSEAEWENTLLSVPDLMTLSHTRKKLEEQFPASPEEAIIQAQDALFQKALTQKLRDEVTKEIMISALELEEFYSQYRADSSAHVLYLARYRDLETAALELKRDEYWNTWLSSQGN